MSKLKSGDHHVQRLVRVTVTCNFTLISSWEVFLIFYLSKSARSLSSAIYYWKASTTLKTFQFSTVLKNSRVHRFESRDLRNSGELNIYSNGDVVKT
jgi:hypothetical protein